MYYYNIIILYLTWCSVGNRPPNITGSFILYVKTGESVSEMYNADDPDGDAINNFSLKVQNKEM